MRRIYPGLDGLRALAVLVVLVGHLGLPHIESGGVGVDIFFVLSGFLITTILRSEAESTGRISMRNFYARRVLRLAPAMLLTVGFFALAIHHLFNTVPWTAILIATTYAANWAEALYDANLSWLGHFWSLAIEEQYYLVWPWVILVLERTSLGMRRKAVLLLGFAALVAAYRYAMVGIYSAERIYYGLDTHMDGLILGSAFSYLLPALSGEGRLRERTSRLLGYVAAPAALGGLAILIPGTTWEHPWMGRYGFALAALAAAVLIADLVAGSHSVLRRLLERRPLAYMGKISYGIYLWHLPLYRVIARVGAHEPPAVLIALKLSTTVLVAALSYHLVERRFLALKRFFGESAVKNPGPPGATDAERLADA
jgi:peptidoglycan/LPS O-acetylase OafA/YrhL